MGWFLDRIIERAKMSSNTIVLAGGSDRRVIKAAQRIRDIGIARPVVLTDNEILSNASFDFDGITIVVPEDNLDRLRYADELFKLQWSKGIARDKAYELTSNELYYGAMMVLLGEADGMVAGPGFSTADVLSTATKVIQKHSNAEVVSDFYSVVLSDDNCTKKSPLLFVGSGLDAGILADTAILSTKTFEALYEDEPVIAFLSRSTLGSTEGVSIKRVREAVVEAREKAPELIIGGEYQFDVAIAPPISAALTPDDEAAAGKANILVFPDLDSCNITFKAIQCLTQAECFGPITQGLAKPMNGVSPICSVDEIVGIAALTIIQALSLKEEKQANI